MTTEDDFQKRLDKVPHDWSTRLVFADWLQERDDSRAEGYRALAQLRCRPIRGSGEVLYRWWDGEIRASPAGPDDIPTVWLKAIRRAIARKDKHPGQTRCAYFASRRQAEDAAAEVFSMLGTKTKEKVLKWRR